MTSTLNLPGILGDGSTPVQGGPLTVTRVETDGIGGYWMKFSGAVTLASPGFSAAVEFFRDFQGGTWIQASLDEQFASATILCSATGGAADCGAWRVNSQPPQVVESVVFPQTGEMVPR